MFQLTMFPRRGGEFSDDKVATITTQPTSLVVNSDTPQSTLECFSETRSWQLPGQTSRYPCLPVQKPPDSPIAPSQAPRCPMRLRLDQFNGSSNTAVQTCAHHQAHLSMGKYLQLVLGSGGRPLALFPLISAPVKPVTSHSTGGILYFPRTHSAAAACGEARSTPKLTPKIKGIKGKRVGSGISAAFAMAR